MSEPKTAEVKVVPVEPTEEMIEAGYLPWINEAARTGRIAVRDIYLAMLAASPPAETGEGETSFRDIFLSWHEECGTVEVAGPCASPIGKFEARWPYLRKRLWGAAMKNAEALKDEWVKIAKECAK